MIIHNTYGPQFDAADGTIGTLKLVRRYAIVRKADGQMIYSRQGRHMCLTREIAEKRIAEINRSEDGIKEELEVAAWWCYPVHFDPVGPVRKDNDEKDI